eukprot:gene57122-biopygen8609
MGRSSWGRVARLVVVACGAALVGTHPHKRDPTWPLTLDRDIQARWHSQRRLFKNTSQAQQDALLDIIHYHIGTPSKYYVEFGFNCRALCCRNKLGHGSTNTCELHLSGWRGLLLDSQNSNASANLHAVGKITQSNVAGIFKHFKVPKELGYLSVDIDMMDIWVLTGIFHAGWRPRVVTVEYNSAWPCGSTVAPSPENEGLGNTGSGFRISCLFGSSLRSFALLAAEYNYVMLAVVPQLDAFLVRRDLLKGAALPSLNQVISPIRGSAAHGCVATKLTPQSRVPNADTNGEPQGDKGMRPGRSRQQASQPARCDGDVIQRSVRAARRRCGARPPHAGRTYRGR